MLIDKLHLAPLGDPLARIDYVEKLIDSDPFDAACYQAEAGRNPFAKNKISSASGAFQLTTSTAKALGVENVFDIADNYRGFLLLKEENKVLIEHLGFNGNDASLLYSAHYLGGPVLKKFLKHQVLTDTEQAQVLYLNKKALPDFLKIYNRLITKG